MPAVLLAAEETHEAAQQLAMAPLGFGLVALGSLIALLVVTHLFRNIGAKNTDQAH